MGVNWGALRMEGGDQESLNGEGSCTSQAPNPPKKKAILLQDSHTQDFHQGPDLAVWT